MVILGLDLALSCGWCLLDAGAVAEYGVFRIKGPNEGRKAEVKWRQESARLQVWQAWLRSFRMVYGDQLSGVVYEGLDFFAAKGRQRRESFGALRGLVVAELGSLCPVSFVMPSAAKLEVTGRGNASKTEVRLAVNKRFGLDLTAKEHDAADAIAVAWTHYKQKKASAA